MTIRGILSNPLLNASDVKYIYHTPDEKTAYENMQEVTEKWNSKYPNSMKRWKNN